MDIQEDDVRLKLRIAGKVLDLSLKAVLFLLEKLISQMKKHPEKFGEQSINKMVKGGKKLTSLDFKGTDLKDFERLTKRFGVSFAAVKDEVNGGFVIMFKADRLEQMEQVLKTSLKNLDNKKESVKENLHEKKETVKQQSAEKEVSGHEHSMGKTKQDIGDLSR